MEPAKRPTRRVTGSIEDYQIVTKVGEGAFGHVFKAMHRKERSVVALKKIFSGADGSEEGVSFVTIRELKNLNLLRACASTVRLLDVLFAQGQLTMVLEFFDYDLAGLLLSRHAFTTPHVKCLLRQLLEAVAQIHALGLMHRDIKPANVLISGRGELKLADFGLMTTFGDDDENRNNKRSHSTNVVTLWYRSPELLCGRTAYGAEVDVWSVGCIMAEMLLQRTAFPGTNDATQLELIFAVCGSPAPDDLPELPALGLPPRRHPPALPKLFKDLDAPGLDLLGRLLSLNSKARISAKAALAHPYFDAPPRACSPAELPTYPPVHEYEAKRKRQELKLDTEKRTRTDAAAAAPANPPLSASASASATASAPAPTPPSAPPPPPAAAAPPRALRSSPPRPSVAPPPQPPPPAARERPDARPRDRHPSPPPAAAYRTPDRERDGRRADAHAPHSHAPPPRPYGTPWNAYPPPPLPHYFYAPPPPPPHLPPPPPPHYYDERHYAPHSAHRGREFESYAPRDDRRHDERDDGRYARPPPPPPPHYGAHMAPPPPGPWPDGPDDPRWHYRDSARDRRQPYRR